MEEDGRLKLNGIITDYSIWDDTIHLFTLKFHGQFNVYPNILLASDSTYRKIDLYAQMYPNRIVICKRVVLCLFLFGRRGNPASIIISAPTKNLATCRGVLPEAPDFDGEAVEEDEEEVGVYQYRKIA
jgi:hypothetical protein